VLVVAGSEDVVIEGAAFTVHESDLVASSEFASVTFTVKEAALAVDGVPVNAPLEAFKVMPAGSEPAETDQV